MSEWDRYVGLEYVSKGRGPAYDCWGLVCLVYREMAAIELPSYAEGYTSAVDRREVAALIAGEISAWTEIPAGKERPLDCVLMRHGRSASHIGVVVKPGLVLHVAQGHESTIERYKATSFQGAVKGFFRHRDLAARDVSA